MLSEKELEEEFKMDHLKSDVPEKTEDLKKEIEATPDKEESKEDPKAQREYTFHFHWKAPKSTKVWEGDFTNKILDIRTRSQVGVMRSRLALGVPLESLDELTAEINLMISHMAYSLIKAPKWAEDLRDLTSVRLLQELYAEVLAHESTFHGYTEDKEAS